MDRFYQIIPARQIISIRKTAALACGNTACPARTAGRNREIAPGQKAINRRPANLNEQKQLRANLLLFLTLVNFYTIFEI